MKFNVFIESTYRNIRVRLPETPDADSVCAAIAFQMNMKSTGKNCDITCTNPPEGSARAACRHFGVNILPHTATGYDTIISPRDFTSEGIASTSVGVYMYLKAQNADITEQMFEALYIGVYYSSNAMREICHPIESDIAWCGERYEQTAKAIFRADFTLYSENNFWKSLSNILATAKTYITPTGARVTLFYADGPFTTPAVLDRIGEIAADAGSCDCTVVWHNDNGFIQFSVRSSVREIMASEILNFICRKAGTVRGGISAASGMLDFADNSHLLYGGYSVITPEIYIEKRCEDYVSECDLIFCGERHTDTLSDKLKFTAEMDFSDMNVYLKTPTPVGYCYTTDFYPAGIPLLIRTLEGDIETVSSDDTYLMIGTYGEIYPIKKERFRNTYKELDGVYDIEADYYSVVINKTTGERIEVKKYAHLCMPSGTKTIRARKISRYTKVFTEWDKERYFFGVPGDMLASGENENNDCYIVRSDIFLKTYESKHSSGIGKLYGLIDAYETAAFVDRLTGMQNRNAYLARKDAFCKNPNIPLGIVSGDVNYLKKLNDSLGHMAGDRLLTVVADAVLTTIPYGTFAARTGGDELVLLFPGGGQAAADRFIANINAVLSQINDGIIGEPSVSWGASELSNESDSFDIAFAIADERMYADKLARKAQRVD